MAIQLGYFAPSTPATFTAEVSIKGGDQNPVNFGGGGSAPLLAVYAIGGTSALANSTATLSQIGSITGAYLLTVTISAADALTAGNYTVRYTQGAYGSPAISVVGQTLAELVCNAAGAPFASMQGISPEGFANVTLYNGSTLIYVLKFSSIVNGSGQYTHTSPNWTLNSNGTNWILQAPIGGPTTGPAVAAGPFGAYGGYTIYPQQSDAFISISASAGGAIPSVAQIQSGLPTDSSIEEDCSDALAANGLAPQSSGTIGTVTSATEFAITVTSGTPVVGQWMTFGPSSTAIGPTGQQAQITGYTGGVVTLAAGALTTAPTAGDAWQVGQGATQGAVAGITITGIVAAVWNYLTSSITTAGSIGVALLAGLAKLATQCGVAVVNPVAQNKNIVLVQGDAYDSTTGQQIQFLDDGSWPAMTSGGVQLGTAEVKCSIATSAPQSIILPVTCVVTGTSPNQVISVPITAVQSGELTPGTAYIHDVRASLDVPTNSQIRELVTGKVGVNAPVTTSF